LPLTKVFICWDKPIISLVFSAAWCCSGQTKNSLPMPNLSNNRLTVSVYYQVSSMDGFYALARKIKKAPKKPSSLFLLIF